MSTPSTSYALEHYSDATGRDLFGSWLNEITDISARSAIAARMVRLELGLFGDCKPLQSGVWELRIHFGAGWRVYYAMRGKRLVLLLAGSDKSHQKTAIASAVKHSKQGCMAKDTCPLERDSADLQWPTLQARSERSGNQVFW